MPVSIVGGRSSGKSVFVSLLINTAIDYSVRMNRHFRVYMDPLTNKVVGEMLSSLKKSMWPPATIRGSLLEYKFSFGYSNHFQRFLLTIKEGYAKISEKMFSTTQISRGELFDTITFKLIDIAGEDVELLSSFIEESRESGLPLSEVLTPSLQYALNSDVIIFLIDAEKVTSDRTEKKYDEMMQYDILMSQLYSFVGRYRSRFEKKTPLYPVFVLTKFDAIDPSIRRYLGVSDDFIRWIERFSVDKDLRWKFFHKFMSTFFKQSLSQIYGVVLAGTELEDAPIFLSYVMTELNEEGVLVPKIVKKGQSNEILYSITEYEAFIRYFGKIANKISDKKRREEEEYAAGIG